MGTLPITAMGLQAPLTGIRLITMAPVGVEPAELMGIRHTMMALSEAAPAELMGIRHTMMVLLEAERAGLMETLLTTVFGIRSEAFESKRGHEPLFFGEATCFLLLAFRPLQMDELHLRVIHEKLGYSSASIKRGIKFPANLLSKQGGMKCGLLAIIWNPLLMLR